MVKRVIIRPDTGPITLAHNLPSFCCFFCYRVSLNRFFFTELDVMVLGFLIVNRVFLGFSWVLLGCTGLYWVLLGFTGLYWVLLGFTGFYRVLLSFIGC